MALKLQSAIATSVDTHRGVALVFETGEHILFPSNMAFRQLGNIMLEYIQLRPDREYLLLIHNFWIVTHKISRRRPGRRKKAVLAVLSVLALLIRVLQKEY